MADTQIITKQELNYVETLYLQCNLEDFISKDMTHNNWLAGMENNDGKELTFKDVEKFDNRDKYHIMLAYFNDAILPNGGEYLNEASGRMWFKFPDYRVGIMNHDKAKKANQYNAVIQYEWEHLYSLDPRLCGLELPFGGTRDKYQFKRIDITKMFKSEYDYLTNKGFISTYRRISTQGTNERTETVYLGNRKNGNVYRMYSKTIELKTDTEKHPINHRKIELLSKYFGDIENLYTFELELHRSYLKEQLEITTLDQLEQVYQAYGSIAGRVRIYEDDDHNKDLISSKHHSRIEAYTITPYVEYKKVYRAKYKPSSGYMYDSINKKLDRYEEQMGELSEFELIEGLIESRYAKIVDISISDIEPTIAPLAYDKDVPMSEQYGKERYKEMIEKLDRMRDNEDNSIYREAKEAFRPYAFNNPNDIF
ncbi:MAG: Unknown protein [uncultured Sulfurovum sp.]|uniref:Uncharacterized protein n=1 Tax=uncultured Sulfurovum sp. TaxID=269237 RepID=A0A6S6S657_9BACT|nr:MAG: Unknown protein [uncultured Sulfurovum sp.]